MDGIASVQRRTNRGKEEMCSRGSRTWNSEFRGPHCDLGLGRRRRLCPLWQRPLACVWLCRRANSILRIAKHSDGVAEARQLDAERSGGRFRKAIPRPVPNTQLVRRSANVEAVSCARESHVQQAPMFAHHLRVGCGLRLGDTRRLKGLRDWKKNPGAVVEELCLLRRSLSQRCRVRQYDDI